MLKGMITIFGIFLLTTSAQASEPLSVDRAVTHSLELSFPNESNIKPEISDFDVLNYILMSNEDGERWVVVTIRNKENGTRTLNQKHLLGLLANGERVHPHEFKQAYLGNETISLTLNFGESKFPVLEVYSRDKI